MPMTCFEDLFLKNKRERARKEERMSERERHRERKDGRDTAHAFRHKTQQNTKTESIGNHHNRDVVVLCGCGGFVVVQLPCTASRVRSTRSLPGI